MQQLHSMAKRNQWNELADVGWVGKWLSKYIHYFQSFCYTTEQPPLYNKTNHQTISLYNWTSLSNHWSILSYHVHIAIHTHIHMYVHTHTMSISCFGGGPVAISLALALSISRVLSVEENKMYIHIFMSAVFFFIWIISIQFYVYTVGKYRHDYTFLCYE